MNIQILNQCQTIEMIWGALQFVALHGIKW